MSAEQCLEAADCVTVLDSGWSCAADRSEPAGDCAAAFVEMERSVLGIRVAERRLEFYLLPEKPEA